LTKGIVVEKIVVGREIYVLTLYKIKCGMLG